MNESDIRIRGARVNNLKNIDVDIPRGKLVVVTGISGSGKSSLAFDTLFAEGQRRFAESLSSYARQFLGRMTKPDVDSIEGIPPAIAIEQKVNIKNPRSTVATTTEIYDYIRLLYARVGRTYSPISGEEVHKDTSADVIGYITGLPDGSRVYILSDLGWDNRDDRVELLLKLKEEGYNRLYLQGRSVRIEDMMREEVYPDGVMLLVDRIMTPIDADTRTRLLSSVGEAFARGEGRIAVVSEVSGLPAGPWTDSHARIASEGNPEPGGVLRTFCNRFERDGITFREPDEYMFSFNSPLGACKVCGGLGQIIGISEDLVVPDKTKSIYDGAIACWRGDKMGWFKDCLVANAEKYGIPIFEPYCNLSREVRDLIWEARSVPGEETPLVGINEFFEWVETQRYKIQYKFMLSRFSGRTECHECRGSRLRPDALYVKVGGLNISELLSMTVDEAAAFFEKLELSESEAGIVDEPLKEIRGRLRCIRLVGLGYLTLNRSCNTLSGGESQRVNLVTALGSSLVGSMYILDEPSIGLHPRDTERLVAVLRRLRDLGNTVVVVEHDEEMIRAADLLIDMGPLAGSGGGEIVFKGIADEDVPPETLERSLTLQYLRGIRTLPPKPKRSWTYSITVEGAMEHNLKDIDVQFPLGVLTVVTGVSGSGKSSLVGDILYPALYRRLNEKGDKPGTFRALSGNIDRLARVEYVDQNPIGRSSRSNAVTYLKIYDEIRKLLSDQQAARINGFGPSSFSFNQEGGRCPECQGEGYVRIEMQFMADVTMVCEQCGGKRFKPDILEVRYRGRNVDDILNMSVSEAIEFFGSGTEPEARTIAQRLQALEEVGLGYIRLGQSSSTLSGGENQRIKLACFLSMNSNSGGGDRIMFIFDEPTTGLHFHDVEKLLSAFDVLLSRGHSLVVVEHNLDVIRSADWVIDLGPDAGADGGTVVFAGRPEDMMDKETFTAKYLYEKNCRPDDGQAR